MSIASRITSIEEHIGDVYDTLELGGAELTNTDKNLVNISPILRQKYIDYMNNGTREIWDNWEKVTGTGSRVTLNNTIQAPMDIGVKGNTTQNQYEGKNLLPNKVQYNGTNIQTNCCNASVEGDEFIFTATGTDMYWGQIVSTGNSFSDVKGSLIEIPSGATNIYLKLTNNALAKNFITFYDSNKVSLGFSQITGSKSIPSNAKYCSIRIGEGNSVSGTTYRTKIMVAITDTDYEPYVGGTASPNPSFPSPIHNVTGDAEVLVQNKNLFDKDDVINAYLNADGTTTSNNTFRVSNYINVKGLDNITISGNYGGSEYCCFYDKNKDFISNFGMGSLTTRTASVPSNAEYIRVTVRQDVLNEYQLQKGSTATTYTQHKEQVLPLTLGSTELCKIGDYQDYFYKDNGKWYIHKDIGKTIITSFSGKSGSTANNMYVTSTITNIKKPSSGAYASNILSSHFISKTPNSIYSSSITGIGVNSNGTICVGFKLDSSLTTLELANTWVSSNNVATYYELETPTNTEITDTTLISQLEAISNAISYDEQTNISGISDGAEPILDIVALKNS